jgi:hypothetical protein
VCDTASRNRSSGGDGVQRGSPVEGAAVEGGVRHGAWGNGLEAPILRKTKGRGGGGLETQTRGEDSSGTSSQPCGPARRACGREDGETVVGCGGPSGKRGPGGVPHLWGGRAPCQRTAAPTLGAAVCARAGSKGLGRTGGGGAAGACFVCGQLGHRAAQQCLVASPAAAAATVAPGVEGVRSVDAEEFRAFQEWRAAVQGPGTKGERGHESHALGGKALPTWVGSKGCGPAAMGSRAGAGRVGVKRGFDDGQRGGLGDGPSAGFPVAPAKRRAPAEAPREVKGQVGAGEGPASWVGPTTGCPGDFACAVTWGTWLRKPEVSPVAASLWRHIARLDKSPTGQRQRHVTPGLAGMGKLAVLIPARLVGLGSGMREEGRDAFNGAVEVHVGVLLELASRAGIQLEDVVAMTGAQLTLGLLPTGILPTAGSASRVAVPDAPPTTVMGAQALDMEVPSAQQPAGGRKEVSWAMIWEAEIQAAHGAPEHAAMGMPSGEELGEPREAGDGGRERAARATSSTEQTKGMVHRVESGALGNDALLLSGSGKVPGKDARVTGVDSVGAPRMEPMGSQDGVSWATVAAGRGAAQPDAKGRARSQTVVGAQGEEQEGKGAADAGCKPVTMGSAPGADSSEPTPGAPGAAQVKDRQPKQKHRHGIDRTVEVAGEGDLPDEVLFEVLAQVAEAEGQPQVCCRHQKRVSRDGQPGHKEGL